MATRNQLGAISAAMAAVFTVGAIPGAALAAHGGREARRVVVLKQDANRQKTKNDWRNLAIAAGGLAALGLLKNDSTLMFAGAAGGLYSLNRYEQDRKSQSQASRARASIFSRPYIYRNGVRYDRKLVKKNGKQYYQFVRRG